MSAANSKPESFLQAKPFPSNPKNNVVFVAKSSVVREAQIT